MTALNLPPDVSSGLNGRSAAAAASESFRRLEGGAVRPAHALDIAYVVPLRSQTANLAEFTELAQYLSALDALEVILVDGSPADVFATHDALLSASVRHLPVASDAAGLNGKVSGVLTGIRAARCDAIIVADADVRYDASALVLMRRALETADVVRPQNYFEPLPWHALIDTGRSLLNRACDGDWPGTLGVRRAMVDAAGGYAADVLFENLEMVRTIRAVGGRERLANRIFVRRLPPTLGHFLGQRIRQAYDEFARPLRLALMLAILPLTLTLLVLGRRRDVFVGALATVGLAEFGRRRAGGVHVFPWFAALAAPLWLTERSVCVWLAVGLRVVHGGIKYSHGRIRRAATPSRVLRQRQRACR